MSDVVDHSAQNVEPKSPVASATKPGSILHLEVKFDVRAILNGTVDAAWKLIEGKRGEAIAASAKGVIGTDLQRTPEERAWLLVSRAMQSVVKDLVNDLGRDKERFEKEDVNDALAETTVTIDHRLFDRPAHLDIVERIKVPLQDRLERIGVQESRAIAARLGVYFTHALYTEWSKSRDFYEPILRAANNPFGDAVERELANSAYRAELRREIHRPMFEENFGLAAVYQPLRAFFEEELKESSEDGAPDEPDHAPADARPGRERKTRRRVVRLEKAIDDWLAADNPDDRIRVISGGPGSGKSSFGKMYAAKLAESAERRVLFIPLQRFELGDEAKGFADAVQRYMHWTPLSESPLDRTSEPLLIILDGLDELKAIGKKGQALAADVMKELRTYLQAQRDRGFDVAAIVAGREPVVQAATGSYFDRAAILHVLPYWLMDGNAEQAGRQDVDLQKQDLFDPDILLDDDQRTAWWNAYATAKGLASELPAQFTHDELTDLTAWPLLNYLVAIACEKGLKVDEHTNPNAVYEKLFDSVWDEWEHKRAQDFDKAKYLATLQEIALASWHGDGRTTTVQAIIDRAKDKNLEKFLGRIAEGVEAGVFRLLVAFFFRESGETVRGDQTYEFTHKSFREYLTTRGIIDLVAKLPKKLDEDDPDDRWDETKALKRWAKLCGPTAMDHDLARFLRREVQRTAEREGGKEQVRDWKIALTRLFEHALRRGLPMHEIVGLEYLDQARHARNAEEALLVLVNACARALDEPMAIDWPRANEAPMNVISAWINRVRGDLSEGGSAVVLASLSRLEFKESTGGEGGDDDPGPRSLMCLDLRRSNLSRANLSHSILAYCNLIEANLNRAKLNGAELNGAKLNGAELDGAKLDGANLDGANLIEANLNGAKLNGAELDGAKLDGAKLNGAELNGAELNGANLNGAELDGAELDGAKLDGANLIEANLYGAKLNGASLYGAKLNGANLIEANLYGANLIEANLIEANLYGAKLNGANLYGAKLNGANLYGANFERAALRACRFHTSVGLDSADFTDADLSGVEGMPDEILDKWTKINAERQAKRDRGEDPNAEVTTDLS